MDNLKIFVISSPAYVIVMYKKFSLLCFEIESTDAGPLLNMGS